MNIPFNTRNFGITFSLLSIAIIFTHDTTIGIGTLLALIPIVLYDIYAEAKKNKKTKNAEKNKNTILIFEDKIRIYLNKIREIDQDIQDRVNIANKEIKNLNINKSQYEKNEALEIFDTHYTALKQLKTNLEVKGEIVTRLKGEIDYALQQHQSIQEFKKEVDVRSKLINNLIKDDTRISTNVEKLAVDMASNEISIQVLSESAYKVLYVNDFNTLTGFNQKLIEQQNQTEAIIQTIEDLKLA